MAKSRYVFSNVMTLAQYGSKLNQEQGTSPAASVGSDYGSFLGAYLTHHLMHPPKGMTAEGVLARDAETLQGLVKQGCQVTFNPSKQLPEFYKFLTKNVAVYHRLLELGLLKVEEQCDDGNTFLNTYFNEVVIDSVQAAHEAIALVASTKPCLMMVNKAGVFPLDAFFNNVSRMIEQGSDPFTTDPVNEALIEQWQALCAAFALDQEHAINVDVSRFVEQCAKFYKAHENNKPAISFLYFMLTKAVNYGLELHRPLKALDGDSFMVKMVDCDALIHWPTLTLREYYRSLNAASSKMMLKVITGVIWQPASMKVNAAGDVEGVVRIEGGVPESFQPYSYFSNCQQSLRDGRKTKQVIFDIMTAGKVLPAFLLPASDGGKPVSLVDTQLKVDRLGKEDRVVCWPWLPRSFGEGIKLSRLPAEMRFGLPTKTGAGYDVCFSINIKKNGEGDLSVFFFNEEDGCRSSILSDNLFERENKEKLVTFRKQYYERLKEALENPDNYFPPEQYYRQGQLQAQSAKDVNLLEYYLLRGGQVASDDPRSFYRFQRRYQRKSLVDSRLTTNKVITAYESQDSDGVRFFSEDHGESYEANRNIDFEILKHLKKIGYDFNTAFVEARIVSLLKGGNFADPSLYRLMDCFRECGAKFPAEIDGVALSDYVQEKLRGLTPDEKFVGVRDHFRMVLTLFKNEKSPTMLADIRDYAASFGVRFPGGRALSFKDIQGYLLSDNVIGEIVSSIDLSFPTVNKKKIDIKADVLNVKASMANGKGNAKLVMQGASNYVLSDEYVDLHNEDAYFQLYYEPIRRVCEALQVALAQAMSVKSKNAPLQGFFKGIKRNAKIGLQLMLSEMNKHMQTMLEASPGTKQERVEFLRKYKQLFVVTQKKINDGNQDPKNKVPSQRVRDVLTQFLNNELLGESIQITGDMQRALEVLSPSFDDQATTPGDEMSEEEVENIVKAADEAQASLAGASAPPVDDESVFGATEPVKEKYVGMFEPRKAVFSKGFLTDVANYERKIRELFYNDTSSEALIQMIEAINEKLGEGAEIDSANLNCLCPLTNRVPFYPCGLGEELAYLEIQTLMSPEVGGKVKGVDVNESTIVLLSNRELMGFFSQVRMLHQAMGLSLEEEPRLKR